MSRDIVTLLENALDDDVIYPFFAIELQFDSPNTLRLWTGQGTLSYGGYSWYGAGELLNVSSIEETTEIAAKGATLTLSAVPSEVISLALTEPYQGRICNIYFGVHISGQNDNSSMTEIFTGYMDQMNIEEGPDTSTIQLSVENRLVDLERARIARYTSAYQKSKYPTDLGFDFVESLQDQKLVWGRSVE